MGSEPKTRVRVYRYGLMPPTANEDLVAEQIFLAHRYRNLLIEVERNRRAVVAEVMSAHPDVARLEAEVKAVAGEVDEAVGVVKAARQKARRRADTAEDRARVRDAKAHWKELRVALREAKRALREDETVQARLAEVNARANELRRAARKGSGVYWGTYLLVEQSVEQACKTSVAPPRFSRWTGRGAVSVQLQGGLDVEDFLAGEDTRLQFRAFLRPVPGRKGKHRPRVRLRVGSEGREPVWGEWPVILHRPLPEGARIKWAKVVRNRHTGKDEWSLHLTVEFAPEPLHRARGTVAVDLGWRLVGATSLRAGYYRSADGEAGEVLLEDVVGAHRKVADLRSIRDKNMAAMQDDFLILLAQPGNRPAWFVERTRYAANWRSPRRFAALALEWRGKRFLADEEMYEVLEEWRKRDKHLWLWEANQRRKTERRRLDQFRKLARRLADAYETLVVEDLDLTRFTRIPAPEDDGSGSAGSVRLYQKLAAPGTLRDCLVQAFSVPGRRIVRLPSKDTTRKCHICLSVQEWDQRQLRHECDNCGAEWDQDDNACRNMLREAIGAEALVVPESVTTGRFQTRRENKASSPAW